MTTPDSMYLVLPVPFRMADGTTFVEAQAANGLDRWADNFAHIVVAAPVIPESELPNLAGFVWRDVDALEHRRRIVCQPLPWAYTPGSFVKALAATRRLIAESIAQCEHQQFAIGGLVGDWAAVAALEAIKQRRRYAIHTDRVEHELIRKTASGASGLRRLKIAVEAPLMKSYHRHIIRHCSLGLWHGDDCFRAYSPWCRENHLVHDIHTKQSDLIDEDSLRRKLEDIRRAEVLQVCYAGRLDPMKAPLEWLRAIAAARDLGARLQATWYGEGALMAEAKAEAQRLQLDGIVAFPGFVANRAELLAAVRAAQAMVFTHITPESPRNLLEALVSGTPILGYDNAYAVNLLEEQGGGELVPMHDSKALGTLIASLAKDRERLAEMTRRAANNGRRFTDAAVFAERSLLVKDFA
jgi:glycosyltransferase involved in cell wall biosynthesis